MIASALSALVVLVTSAAPAGARDDRTIDPLTAAAVAGGAAAGATAGLLAGAVVAAVAPPEASAFAFVSLLGGAGLGAGIGAGTIALLLAPEHALLSSTTAFAAAPIGMIVGALFASGTSGTLLLFGQPKLASDVFGPLLLVGFLGGGVSAGAWGALVGAGLPQE